MSKFFRICGVLFFLGVVVGFCLIMSSAMSNSLADALIGIAAAFVSAALGLLFIYVAELLDRIRALEQKLEAKRKD
ncbi:MAG: hypothetical protein IJZ89_02630 [Clostridia bacterium]|nr:hypothetical protein [Clostridia bacterium]